MTKIEAKKQGLVEATRANTGHAVIHSNPEIGENKRA